MILQNVYKVYKYIIDKKNALLTDMHFDKKRSCNYWYYGNT